MIDIVEERKNHSRLRKKALILTIQRGSHRRPALSASIFEELVTLSGRDVTSIKARTRVKETVSEVVWIAIVSVPSSDSEIESFVVLVGREKGSH